MTVPSHPQAGADPLGSRTAAHQIIAALALPAPPPAPGPPRPLPLPGLHQLPREISLLYDIAPIDSSGRVRCKELVDALRWQPGDKLEMILAQSAIVIRPSPDGAFSFSVSQRPLIIIPAAGRHRHAIRTGDHVLLAAAPDYGTVIVYPLSALDEMITRYHSEPPAAG